MPSRPPTIPVETWIAAVFAWELRPFNTCGKMKA
jgi:hypothetical protein